MCEKLEDRVRRECRATMMAGEEMGMPTGISLRIVRRMIASHGLPQPSDLVDWLTEGHLSDRDVKIDVDEMIAYAKNFMANRETSIPMLERSLEEAAQFL